MRKLAVLLIIFFSLKLSSQELFCRVNVNFQNIQITNQQLIQKMVKDITDFMNQTVWSPYIFALNERIECAININLTEFNGVDMFRGTLQVSSNRPVYDASLITPILNLQEKSQFRFTYVENVPIEFNENTYTGELAYTLAFYAYVILGFDFDTFSELGGTEFFQKAQKILQNAQSSYNKELWTSIGSSGETNRYWLINFVNSETFVDFRKALYRYHRLGLDLMSQDIQTGRNNVIEALELIKKVNQQKPNNFLVNIFIETKRKEIINIFSEAPLPEITRVRNIMKLIDPLHSSEYDNIGKKQ